MDMDMDLNYLQEKTKVYRGLSLSDVILNYGVGLVLGFCTGLIILLVFLPIVKAVILSFVAAIVMMLPIGFVLSKFNLAKIFLSGDIEYSGHWTGGW